MACDPSVILKVFLWPRPTFWESAYIIVTSGRKKKYWPIQLIRTNPHVKFTHFLLFQPPTLFWWSAVVLVVVSHRLIIIQANKELRRKQIRRNKSPTWAENVQFQTRRWQWHLVLSSYVLQPYHHGDWCFQTHQSLLSLPGLVNVRATELYYPLSRKPSKCQWRKMLWIYEMCTCFKMQFIPYLMGKRLDSCALIFREY